MIALIPARAGSKRVPGKNTRLLNGHPLIAYTIAAAEESGVFERIIVSTDDTATAAIASEAGAELQARPSIYAQDDSPDILWIRNIFETPSMLLKHGDVTADSFAILRPTSPFRTAATIQRAYDFFIHAEYDSIRAVEPVTEHPGKMWVLDNSVYGGRLEPLIAGVIDGTPWHSCPTQSLPPVYKQNSSLEMAWTRVVTETHTISGTHIGPFFTEGYEGFVIDSQADWDRAEALAAASPTRLPALPVARVPTAP